MKLKRGTVVSYRSWSCLWSDKGRERGGCGRLKNDWIGFEPDSKRIMQGTEVYVVLKIPMKLLCLEYNAPSQRLLEAVGQSG